MPLKRKCATDSSDAVEACHGEEGTKGCLGGKDESVGREQMRLRDGVAKGMERLKQLRLRECDVVDPLQEQESCRTLDKMLTSYNEAISILDKIIAFAPSDSVEKSQPDTYDDPNNKPSSTPIFKNYKREASTKWTMNIRLPPGVYHDDGYSWRKYGSKPILGSIYPRDYYRCTSKHKDCPARKQVQRCDADPDTIEVTYHGRHTCYKKSASKPSTIDQPFMP